MNRTEAATLVGGAYVAWLTSELCDLPLIPISTSDRTDRLPLETVYVPMRVIARTQMALFEQFKQGQHDPEAEHESRMAVQKQLEQSERVFRLFSEPQLLPVNERPRDHRMRQLLLIGDAGSGKTTTLHYGALILAQAWPTQDVARVRAPEDAVPEEAAPKQKQGLGLETGVVPLPIYLRLTLAMKWLREPANAGAAIPLLHWLDTQVPPQITQFLEKMGASVPSLPTLPRWQAALAITPLSALVKTGGCLLLLDGLDETGDEQRRAMMQGWISALVTTCPHNLYLVASRPFAGSAIPGFVERHLSPLNSKEMRTLLDKWFKAADDKDRQRLQQRRVRAEVAYLWAILEATPRLFDMCTNPLLLTSVALLVYTGVGLPRERAELYSRLVYLLLETWRVLMLSGGHLPEREAERPVLFRESVSSVQRLLQQLAAWMQEQERREVSEAELTQVLAREYVEALEWTEADAKTYVADLLHSLAINSGLLQHRDAGFSFAHYTLQEYLTARNYDRAGGPEALLQYAEKARWRETILLAVGHWMLGNSTERAQMLLKSLLETNKPALLLLAGDALDDADIARGRELASLRRETIRRLHALAFFPAACPDPVQRNRAASLLDRLDGDLLRPGLDLTNDDYWAAWLEPGTFSMGSMGDDQGADGDEKPAFDCRISRPYRLARFPVTNRQYFGFVEALAGRGAEQALQAAQALRPLMAQHEQTPEQFRPRFWPGARYRAGEGNHPVVGVTWYAATAYAWWADAYLRALGRLLPGESVRLPTEAEWERAAAYPSVLPGGNPRAERRTYPWGDVWPDLTDPANERIRGNIPANTSESGIGGTSVMGIFPHGVAACGAEELAGNVWEWCSTPKLDYSFTGEPTAETLYTVNGRASSSYVLRGGAWLSSQVYARCAYRLGRLPRRDNAYNGLRLAHLFSSPVA